MRTKAEPSARKLEAGEKLVEIIVHGLCPFDLLDAGDGRLGLARPTARQAIQELVKKGLLVRKRGVGTQVVRAQISRETRLTSLFDDLSRSGHEPWPTASNPGHRLRRPASPTVAVRLR